MLPMHYLFSLSWDVIRPPGLQQVSHDEKCFFPFISLWLFLLHLLLNLMNANDLHHAIVFLGYISYLTKMLSLNIIITGRESWGKKLNCYYTKFKKYKLFSMLQSRMGKLWNLNLHPRLCLCKFKFFSLLLIYYF